MFGSNNKEKGKSKFSFAADSISSIASSMKVLGDLEAEHDMRIDGHVVGNVYCKAKMVLGETAVVEGDIHVQNADILGKVLGNITADGMLSLKSKSQVNGNLTVGQLIIDSGAKFNGKCTMSTGPNSETYVDESTMVLQN